MYVACNFFFNYKFQKLSRWSLDVYTKIIFIILMSVLKTATIHLSALPQQPALVSFCVGSSVQWGVRVLPLWLPHTGALPGCGKAKTQPQHPVLDTPLSLYGPHSLTFRLKHVPLGAAARDSGPVLECSFRLWGSGRLPAPDL